MKSSLLKVSAALCVALVHTTLSEQRIGAGNFTLTRCPPPPDLKGSLALGWRSLPSSTRPKTAMHPDDFDDFIVQWEAAHLLTWEKEDDEPRNLAFSLGEYTLQVYMKNRLSLVRPSIHILGVVLRF